jgi:L-asparaginase
MAATLGHVLAANLRDMTRPIHVLATGGTIDKVYSMSGDLEIGPPAVTGLLEVVGTDLDVTVEPIIGKDSLHFSDADRAAIARRVEELGAARVLITHGTDTMTITADHLAATLDPAVARTVVLTGAMQPASMRESDAAFNVGLALGALQTLSPGIYIAMSGRIFPAGDVSKDRTRGVFVDRV